MRAEAVSAFVTRSREIEAQILELRGGVTSQEISESDRRYLSRCFELLQMELNALRDYIEGLR
jgi:hypothetical protein